MSDETDHKPLYGEDYSRKTYFFEGEKRKSYETITIDLTGYERALLDLIFDHEPDIARSVAQEINAEHKAGSKPAKTPRNDIYRMLATSGIEAKALALLGLSDSRDLPIAKHLKDLPSISEEKAKYWIERVRLAGGVKCAEYLSSLDSPSNQAEVDQLHNTASLVFDLFVERKVDASYSWLISDETHLYNPVLSIEIRRILADIAETESQPLADYLSAIRHYPHELSKEHSD